MFIGRQKELNELDRLYRTGKFQCVIIYGRRRVGKTALINEFIRDKDAIYFTGQETNSKENLENLSQSIMASSTGFTGAAPIFANYKEAVEAIFSLAETKRIVFVIDEYPYLASSYNGISSLLQTSIDRNKENSKIFIILCGSSLSFMENQVLGYKSPLYGRRTAQFKVLPFDYEQTYEFFSKDYAPEDIAVFYGITGGIPMYLSLMDTGLSLAENIKRNFLSPSGYLFEEPGNLIKQECREPGQYNAVIKAIANGATRLSEISGKTGMETSACSAYITKLISIGIIKKERPFREETGKKVIYGLEDGMFRFWYRFTAFYLPLISRGEPDLAYGRIEPQIPEFMGAVFEKICTEYLWRKNIAGQLPILFNDAGRWWGNDPRKHAECEIDIIADNKDEAIFAECKWKNEDMGLDVLNTLIDRSGLFRYDHKYYYLFSKKGFTKALELKAAEMGNVSLVCFDMILETQ